MKKDILDKLFEYKFKVAAIILFIMGASLVIKGGYVTSSISSYTTLDKLHVKNLKSGMAVKDTLSYTYGDITAWTKDRRHQYTYAIDIGGNHEEYINLVVTKESDMTGKYKLADLTGMIPGYYEDRYANSTCEFYGIIEKTDKTAFPYNFYTNVLGKSVSGIKSQVSTEYQIKLVNPKVYKIILGGGIVIILLGVLILVYEKVEDIRDERLIAEMNYSKRASDDKEDSELKGPFSKGILDKANVNSIKIIDDTEEKVVTEKDIIENLIKVLNDVKEYTDFADTSGDNYIIQIELDDCTYKEFTLYDDYVVKYIGGFYRLNESAFDSLVKEIGKIML